MRSGILAAIACVALAGCAVNSGSGEVDENPSSDEAALKGGCRWWCPKCPPNKICPKIACREICNGKDKSGPACGPNTCAAGDVCCNESCGICTPPDGMCTQQFCEPNTGACTQIALCIDGFTWDEKACACVPVPTTGGCTTDADCRTFSDYCTGCDCRALSSSEPNPTCDGPGVRCFADPCMGKTAACVAGKCSLL
jgi:hypothetical protein